MTLRIFRMANGALRALAAAHREGGVPEILRDLKTKAAIVPLVRWETDVVQGDHVQKVGTYADTSNKAAALQDLLEGGKSDADREARGQATGSGRAGSAQEEVRFAKIPGFFPTQTLDSQCVSVAQLPQSQP